MKQQTISRILLGIQALGLTLLTVQLIVDGSPSILIWEVGFVALLYAGLFGAYYLGWDWARYAAVGLATVSTIIVLPEPFLTQQISYMLFNSPIQAMILASPIWVAGSAAATYIGVLAKAGWQGVYMDLTTLIIYAFLIGGIILSRVMTNTAQRAAEANAQALEAERALLARRIAERTTKLQTANAELAHTARLKDEFLASMSHELRTPLNAVLGLSESLQEEVYGPLTPKQQSAIHQIAHSGQHLLALISDILDLSKIAANKAYLEWTWIDVDTICKDCIELIRESATRKRQQIMFTLDSRVETCHADERRFKQILINLLSNAVKFTLEGGSIGLEVRGDTEQQCVHFIVWDTGIGIAEEDIPLLFQPFVQLDGRLSRRYEGTGLGLALVSKLIDLHKGKISVDSSIGQGSRFTVSLPWQLMAHPTAAQSYHQALVPSQQKIQQSAPVVHNWETSLKHQGSVLLVEDNQPNQVVIADFLHSQDYKVIVAPNGHEAIRQARKIRPDIIIMDIQMPDMDGIEATRQIRADPDLTEIPIIALTALAMPGDRERCMNAGMNAYFSKPVRLRELSGMIAALITVECP